MADSIKWEGRMLDLSEDECWSCGFAFTPVEELWPPQTHLWPACDCERHEHPAENERRQHRIGHHRYRAWTKAQARREQEKAAAEIARWRR